MKKEIFMDSVQALGKVLIKGGFLSDEAEITALTKVGKEKNETFLSSVIKAKKLNPQTVAFFLANHYGLPYLDPDFIDSERLPEFDTKILEKYKILPIRKINNSIFILISDPTEQAKLSDLKFQLNVNTINVVVGEEEKIINIINKNNQNKVSNFNKEMEAVDGEILEVIDDEQAPPTEEGTDEVDDAPVVKFVQTILLDAVRNKVSDIHFEPYEKMYRVRYRLDGILFQKTTVPLALKDKISSRIKVMSKMDISEKRIPQDGRTKIKISADRAIDFRVSSLPTLFGEKIVMRILDNSPSNLNLDVLGYDEVQKKRLTDAVKRPYGMVLVTGPTGSGKTVSLYSCLHLLNKEDINISTAEDPAEINLPGINQVNMNDKAGLTFAASLKAFLRQDPDIIMVGEIRDLETADISIKAAQTGHLVLSTLHTNDAPTTLTRLMNMGVAPFNIASSVILITAQRLARKLCPICKAVEDLPADVLLQAGFLPEDLQEYNRSWKTYKHVGCGECGNKGYKGRVGIYQVMPITEEMQKIILNAGNALDIAAQARVEGVLSLREAGLLKVKGGVTSLEEIVSCTNSS